jgi:hypothetical protein
VNLPKVRDFLATQPANISGCRSTAAATLAARFDDVLSTTFPAALEAAKAVEEAEHAKAPPLWQRITSARPAAPIASGSTSTGSGSGVALDSDAGGFKFGF